MRLLHEPGGRTGEFLPKTRSIAVWDTTPGRMPIYYTNAILDDDLPDQIKLFDFSAMDPVIWDEQRALVSSLIAEHELIG